MKRTRIFRCIAALALAIILAGTTVEISVFAVNAAGEDKCMFTDCGGTYENGFCSNNKTHCEAAAINSAGGYEISNAGQLYWFADKVNNDNTNYGSVKAVLVDNIVVNMNVLTAEGELASTTFFEWTPIGASNCKYTGTFDGQGYTISGLYYNATDTDYIGLFGAVSTGGIVQNVGVKDSYFNARGCVGGVAGANVGTVSNCYNMGTVIGSNDVGGVIGYNNSGTAVKCYNAGNVKGTVIGTRKYSVGGVLGYNKNGAVSQCYNIGMVIGSNDLGGIAGGNDGTVNGCYNTGAVSGTEKNIAGVIGYNNKNGTVSNCYNTGSVNGSASVGGVAGLNIGTVTNCYYNKNIYSGNGIGSESGLGNVTGMDSQAFASGEVAYLLNGTVDTDTIFYQNIDNGQTGDNIPVLDQTHGNVYQGYKDCETTEVSYSNSELHSTPGHKLAVSADSNCITEKCDYCGKKNTYTLTTPVEADLIYSGKAIEAACIVSENLSPAAKPVIAYSGEGCVDGKPVNVGTYTASITVGDRMVSVDYTIKRAVPKVIEVPVAASTTYNPANTLAAISLTGGTVKGVDGNVLEGFWRWKNADTVPTVNNRGYEAVFTPMNTTSYETVIKVIAVKVKPMEQSITQTTNQPQDYNGTKEENTTSISGDAMSVFDSCEVNRVETVPSGWEGQKFNKDTILADGTELTEDAVYTGADASNTIPVEIINKVTGERYFMNISLFNDGELGFATALSINMDPRNSGFIANLLYFNKQTEGLEFVCADEIAEDGIAELTFTHASEYTIVIDEKVMDSVETSQTPLAEDTDTTNVFNPAEFDPDNGASVWCLILFIVVFAVAAIVAYVVYSKKKREY